MKIEKNNDRNFWNEINFSLCDRKIIAPGSSYISDAVDDDDDNNDNANTYLLKGDQYDSGLELNSPSSKNSSINHDEENCICDMSNMIAHKFLRCCCKLDFSSANCFTTNFKKLNKNFSASNVNNNMKQNNNFMPTPKKCCTQQKQFSRSSVGGSKFLLSCHPTLEPSDLIFESRFESGNLAKAVKITPTYYELYLRPDMYTNRHTQWFYFRIKNTRKNVVYR